MNVKNNKRKQQSREKIEKVFIELLQENEISKITVSDICKRTELNRSTFYSNYSDIYELADKIREKLEKEVSILYEDDVAAKQNSNVFLRLFRHIKENQLFYKTYFKLGYDNTHKINLYDLHLAYKYFKNNHIEYHIEFFKAGFNAIVKKWLSNDCKEEPEELAKILENEYAGRKLI